jgi:TolB-like protein
MKGDTIMRCTNQRGAAAVLLGIVLALLSGAAHAQKILSEGVKDLATQIATVLPFRELDGNSTVLSTYISEELVTNLFIIGGLDIVERSMLDKLLGEIRLGETGVIDQETATKVGKIAGVDAIVTGTITDLQSYVALNCRLIDARTGRIFGAAQAKIVKDDDVRKIMGSPLPASSSGMQGQPSGPAKGSLGKQDPAKVGQQQQANGFLFELKKCTLSGSSVECDLLITNNKDDRDLVIYSETNGALSRLIDPNGNEYLAANDVLLGSSRSSRPQSTLASGIPTRAKIAFENIAPDIEVARLVEIICWSESHFRVQFRNVPLVRP